LIISRTPFRISFVGGGTDLKAFYEHEEGKVISSTIDKYIYVTVKRQLDLVENKYRISWSKLELRDNVEDIEHPIVREALKLMNINFPIEITTIADIPANTGLGSSSAFAVGLIHVLYALKGQMVTKNTLASMAAHIEIDILKRNIGAQDHYAAAYGNLNVFIFHKNGSVSVEPVFYDPVFKEKIQDKLMLFYTGLKRDASEVLKSQKENMVKKLDVMKRMKDLVDPLRDIISSGKNENKFGETLHKGWILKKSITKEISNKQIDEYYNRALKAGAIGGKLLGAGGGGFLLIYSEPKHREAVIKSLSGLHRVHFKFDDAGSRITYYDQRLF